MVQSAGRISICFRGICWFVPANFRHKISEGVATFRIRITSPYKENPIMAGDTKIGFIGTGVMGARMCRNLAKKIRVPVIAFDMDMDKVAALSDVSVEAAPSIEAVVNRAEIILMCLPGRRCALSRARGKR